MGSVTLVADRSMHMKHMQSQRTSFFFASVNTELDNMHKPTCRQITTYLLDVGTGCWQITNRC